MAATMSALAIGGVQSGVVHHSVSSSRISKAVAPVGCFSASTVCFPLAQCSCEFGELLRSDNVATWC